MDTPQAPEQRVEIAMPESVVPGVYADLVGVWHTADSFVLDFSAMVEPGRVEQQGSQEVVVRRAQVVARVRVPPSQVFEIMKVLEQQLTSWEREAAAAGDGQDGPVDPDGFD